MNIYLTGMPGSGKTTWGKQVAVSYRLPFLDLDEYIGEKHKTTITTIFEHGGEAMFRTLESQALQEVIAQNKHPFVLSCGGGTSMDDQNFSLLKTSGCIIYLKASTETLLRNLKHNIGSRPLLNYSDPETLLSQLYEQRKAVYEKADYILEVESLSIHDFEPILQLCTKQL